MKNFLHHLHARNLSVLLIGVPAALCALYLYVLAADRYVSESVVTVKQSGDQAIGLGGLASIFQVSGASSHGDLLLLQSHIHSMDMLQVLDQKLNLRKAYSAPERDVLLRLSGTASIDAFLRYYRDRVEARYDDTSGLLVLRTQGFNPDEAQAINRTIVEASEVFINRISQRLAQEQMSFAAGELARTADKFQAAKSKILAFQERNRVLDPAAQMKANTMLTLELQTRLAHLETDLRSLSSYMDESSFQIRSLRQQAESLRTQIASESARGTSVTPSNPRLNTLAADFRALEIEVNFAEQAYKSATLTMETARLESTRKIKTLVLVASPTKPHDAEYPRRAYDLLALLLAFSLVFGIVRLMVATIEDHLD